MSPTAVEQPNPTAIKVIAALAGLISLLVLVQAVTGGVLARNSTKKGLINAHSGVAYLTAVLALAAVVVAFMMWRGKIGGSVVIGETVALLVGVVIQIGIGQQIGDVNEKGKHAGLLALHIPVALLVFGLALHLSTFVSNVRRGAALRR
jgi:hypothetical protein